jgi:predicted nuclease of predicted toxin-antitoxin system
MLRFLADENFDNRILHAMLQENTEIDVLRVQDLEIYQASDPVVLEWAAQNDRVVLTRDIRTMRNYAHERVRQGKPMPGVIQTRRGASIKTMAEDILILAGASQPGELEGQVIFVPL